MLGSQSKKHSDWGSSGLIHPIQVHLYTFGSRLTKLNAEKMTSAPLPKVEPSPTNIAEEVDSPAKVPLEKGDSLEGGPPNDIGVLEDVHGNALFGRVENEGKFRFSIVILFVSAAISMGFHLLPEYYFCLLHW